MKPVRKCMTCNQPVLECMASVLAGDFMKFLVDNTTFVREKCGKCVVKEMIKEKIYV